ncbi:MAG: hypothetical protein ACR2G3_04075 [Solirubrobacterales bacterium]
MRNHFNPPTVISVIALCVAVGGGYALAVTGSGSLERAKEVGVTETGSETIVALTGIGRLKAACEGTGSPVSLSFKNTSGGTVVSRSFEENADDFASGELADGETSVPAAVGVGGETIHWVVSPAGAAARPQADMSVTVTPSIAGSPSCDKAEVAAIATTTEE